ncbi:BTAD domain-containing putative transcriptional regulator [Nocardia sp. NPDC051030]|uniref:BTAD domain-containing putative transcriptional regulator n=1 Tax=Nocardia sp. NPDC051030 TaxID=3155162 RepID=UPI0034346BAD
MVQPGAVEVTLLNGVEVRRDGHVEPLGPPQRRAVLCALALRRRQWISAAGLLDALYEDALPASGIGVIQTHISALRRVLEPDRTPRTPPTVLLSGHGGYQLRIDEDQLDVGVFDRLVGEAARARQARDWEGAERSYAEALALYSGEPLAGVPGPFAESQRAALSERRLAVLEDSLDIAVLRGRTDAAIDSLRMLIAEYPLRERPRAALMRALADGGRRSEALDVYRDTRRVLVGQLGVEPGAELRRLQEQILSGAEPADRPRSKALDRGPNPVAPESDSMPPKDDLALPQDDSALPLVFDREQELARIAACARRAATGVGGMVVITGRPGYGKTQLLNEVAREHRHALRVDLTSPSGDQDLVGLLLERLGDRDSLSDNEITAGDRLYAALAGQSARRPLVLLIDDATRMDDRSARILSSLAPRLRGLPVLIVLTLDERSWDRPVLNLHATLEPAAAAVLRPGGLSEAAIAGLYERRIGKPCPPGLAAEIQRATGEIPLVAGALITDLATLRDGSHVPDRLPEGCYSRSIQRQLGRYSAAGVRMLKALAVLHEFGPTADILAAACGENVAVVRHRCELLATVGILAAADPPRFRHPLLANTIRWLCPGVEAAEFRTAAAAQARAAGYSARQVAAYLQDLSGDRYAPWTVVLIDAAEECLRRNLIPEAVRWLETALRICTPEDRDDLLCRLGQLELWTNPAAARAHLSEALRSQRARAVAPTALIPLAWTLATRREAVAAMALVKQVLAETEGRDPVAAHTIRASEWMVAALTAPTWRDYTADLRAGGVTDRITTAVLTWDQVYGTQIDARTAVERLALDRIANHVDTPPRQLYGMLAILSMWAGDLTTALQLSDRGGDQHFGTIDTYRLIIRVEVLLRGGAFEQVLREVSAVVGEIDDELLTPPATLLVQYAEALLALGRVDEAEQWLDRAMATADPETWEMTVALRVRGMLSAARGFTREAIAHYLDCGRRVGAAGTTNPANLPWRSMAALELLRLGERERARELAAAELVLAERWNSPQALGRTMRAMALAAPGGTDLDLLERAVDRLRTAESPVELIPALLDLAQACGDPERARSLLWEARTLAESISAAGYLDSIDGLVHRLTPGSDPIVAGQRGSD